MGALSAEKVEVSQRRTRRTSVLTKVDRGRGGAESRGLGLFPPVTLLVWIHQALPLRFTHIVKAVECWQPNSH